MKTLASKVKTAGHVSKHEKTNGVAKMSISIIYRVSHTLPDALTVFLEDHGDINRKFEVQIMQDQKGNVSAGANSYSDREEWAEFNDKMQAEACDKAMRRTIATFHTLAIS